MVVLISWLLFTRKKGWVGCLLQPYHLKIICGLTTYHQQPSHMVPYSLNILRGKSFDDFAVLGVVSKNFSLEIFRPLYSLIHFGSICKSMKILFLATLLNLEIFAP